MPRINQPLSTAQAARFEAAMACLGAGRPSDALAIASALVREAPIAADAHQLLAICAAGAGSADLAEASFTQALRLAPEAPVVALNFATWLRGAGRLYECLALLERAPATAEVLLQRGLTALRLGRTAQAVGAFEQTIALDANNVLAWDGLGNALSAQGEWERAAAAFERATTLSAGYAQAWLNLGTVLRLLGRVDEALTCLRRAEALGLEAPELQDAISGVLQDLGRPDEAMTVARALVARRPDFAAGHETLAHLQWENAPASAQEADPLEGFRSAAYAQPAHRELQLRYLRMLLSTRRAEDALTWLDRLRGVFPGDVLLDWLAADALDMCGQLEEAGATYARLQPALGASSPAFLNSHARNAFRRGRPDLAATCAALALGLAPHDQEAWAHRGTAWRLVGDAREEWLFDYTRLVGEVDVELPRGNSDPTQGLDALTRVLDAMHLARRPPVNQSVRMGSQTPGRLFGRRDPVIRDTAAAIEATVLRWLATLPEVPDHPFLARRRAGVRCVGSWSVRLTSSGHHANHIHNEGWLSSAFYVSLPPSVANATEGSTNGWIQFGQPMSELGLALPPRRMIRPQRGRLLLFPSFMWHGTVPFEDTEPRLTVAFDMRPA